MPEGYGVGVMGGYVLRQCHMGISGFKCLFILQITQDDDNVCVTVLSQISLL